MFTFTASIRLRNNGKDKASWHFVSIPSDISNEITSIITGLPAKRGWKSVKVQARIGFVTRQTSIFPSKETGCYILPLKKDIRNQLQVGEGDEISIELTLI